MWKRRVMKKKAIALLKHNYRRMVSVCFLIAILTTAYSVSTTFLNLQIPSSPEPAEAVFTLRIPNSEAVIGAVRNFAENTPLPGLLGGILEDALAILIDLFSSTISTFFTLLRTVNTAVAATNHQRPARIVMSIERQIGHHFMVGELIRISQLDDAVKHQKPSQFDSFINLDLLKLAPAAEQFLLDFNRIAVAVSGFRYPCGHNQISSSGASFSTSQPFQQ